MGKINYDYKKNKSYYKIGVKIFEAETKENLEKAISDYCNEFDFHYKNELQDIQYVSPVKLKHNKILYSGMIIYKYYF